MYSGTSEHGSLRPLAAPWGLLPERLHVLHVVPRTHAGSWLADALAADSACDVQLEEVAGVTAALARLRDEVYDAIVVNHDPDQLDAFDFVEGLRAGGSEEPLLILGDEDEAELTTYAYEAGADGYLCLRTTTRTLIWMLARAVDRHQLVRENRRLSQGERQRLQHEHQEADRLLDQQRALLRNLESLAPVRWSEEESSVRPPLELRAPAQAALPLKLVTHYRELLRAHVIMGFGNLAEEMSELAEMLAAANVTAEQTMLLHLQALEELVRGLGARSARHVLTRADLLILEVMIHLADGYRGRMEDASRRPRQRLLPGFERNSARVGS